MLDYNWFGYRPDYGFELYCGNELVDKASKVADAACFARVFGAFYGHETEHRGKYTLRCRKTFKAQSGNYCSLEKPEILKILRYMRKAFDIKITLRETDSNYIFDMDIVGKSIKHKFILTFCRVFFEFPYNEIAKDVMRMRSKGKINGIDFTHKSFFEVYHLICMTYMHHWGGGHSLFCYPSLDVKLPVMKKAFETGKRRVQEVYPGTMDLYQRTSKNAHSYHDIDWEGDFENRVEGYSKNFQIIKELKYEKSIRRRARKRVRKVAH